MKFALKKDCDRVVARFEGGLLTRDQAANELKELERKAYSDDPTAEEDGEITYTVAEAMNAIDGLVAIAS